MELKLLGPFEVIGPGGPVGFGSTKHRLLLALLALRANEVVSTGQLMEGLWGEDPPPTALKTVQGHVARVRRVLESAGMAGALLTREPGYFMQIDSDSIDAVLFERHAQAGRRSVGIGDIQTAEREFAAALGLWRGDALADCRDESDAIAAAAVRFDELRLSTTEDHIDVLLSMGRHSVVIGDIEELVARHPLRERLWSALMIALYRSQRQADALRAYQRARDALVDTLGVEPSGELRRVEAAILQGDSSLDFVAPAISTLVATTAPTSSARLLGWTTSGPPFIGRDREVVELAGLWEQVRDGGRQFVLISGEPGIGKTRLAAETALRAQGDGARVLYGRCDEGLAVPYQPFVEALRVYVETSSDAELARGLGRHRSELARLLPELPDRVADLAPPLQSDAATEQYVLLEAVVEWLTAASRSASVVLVLDDLHWAAPPTVLMLRHVLRSDRASRLLLLGTYRESELDVSHPLPEMLAETYVSVPTSELHRVPLAGLEAPAVAALVEATAGRDLDDAGRQFAETLHTETGGNPFFVNEIVRSLMESGAIAGQTEGAQSVRQWPVDVRVPSAARDVVLRRFARLSDDAQHTLTLAAVIGREFEVAVLEPLADLDIEPVLRALEEAATAGLVHEAAPERFAFAHAIIRGALYDRLSVSRRDRLHNRVAQAIEGVHAHDLRGHLSELAYHYADADPDKAVSYATQAADAALERLAFEDAVSVCERGVAAVDRARRSGKPVGAIAEFDLLLALGKAELLCGKPGRRTLLRAHELACALEDTSRQAAALLALNRGFFSRIGRTDQEVVGALERTVASISAEDSVELAELLASLASEIVWAPDSERRFDLSDRAVAMARRVGNSRSLARVLLLRSMTIQSPDTLADRATVFEELNGIATELGDPAISFDNAFLHTSTAWEGGDWVASNQMQETAMTLAGQLRQPRLEWQASFMETARRLLDGELEEAERCAQKTLDLGQRAGQHTEAFMFFNEQMLDIRRWQDRLDEFVSEFRDLAGNAEFDFAWSLTRYLYDGGEVGVASSAYESIMERLQLPPRRDMVMGATLQNLAYLAARIGDTARAQDIYDALLPYANRFTSTTLAKPVNDHYLGMLAAILGCLDLAERHLARAVEVHERTHAPLILAESRLEYARVLRTIDPASSGAAALLESVRAVATSHGAAFLTRQCDAIDDARSALRPQ